MHGEYEFIQPALYAASIGIWFSVDGNGQITIKNKGLKRQKTTKDIDKSEKL